MTGAVGYPVAAHPDPVPGLKTALVLMNPRGHAHGRDEPVSEATR